MTVTRADGVFLDLDGTLADSLGVMRVVYSRFLEALGRTASDAEFALMNGPPLREVVKALAMNHRLEPPVDELLSLYNRLIDDAYGDVRPHPSAEAVLRAAQRSGFKTGVVTSNAAGRTRNWLDRTGLGPWVDVLVGCDDVGPGEGKPGPYPYRLALARAGCSAEGSMAVEDSLSGARAATAAGLRTFLITADPSQAGERMTPIADLADALAFVSQRAAAAGPDC